MMETRNKILVTGANGQLGKSIHKRSPAFTQFEFVFLGKEDLPVHHFEMVRHYFRMYQPGFLINCAGYTAVDRAESEKDLAFQVNGEAPGVLAAICAENQTKFLHISTDYVFDGLSAIPYREENPVNPKSVYGASKREGEVQVLRYNPASLIIRTSWLYSEYGKNFVRTMLSLMKEKKEIKVVDDQRGTPTYAGDLADAILQIIASGKWVPGIFHFANRGVISWYEFACAIKEISGANCRIDPISTDQYPTPAHRPAYSALDSGRIGKVFGVSPPDWKTSLRLCLANLS